MFVDDEQENIEAAAETGLHTHFYKNLAELKQVL